MTLTPNEALAGHAELEAALADTLEQISGLRAPIASRDEVNVELRSVNVGLQWRLQVLEERLGQRSRNSSRPPLTDRGHSAVTSEPANTSSQAPGKRMT